MILKQLIQERLIYNTLKEEKDGREIWELSSEHMDIDTGTGNVELTKVSGKFYDDKGREVALTADHGSYTGRCRRTAHWHERDSFGRV